MAYKPSYGAAFSSRSQSGIISPKPSVPQSTKSHFPAGQTTYNHRPPYPAHPPPPSSSSRFSSPSPSRPATSSSSTSFSASSPRTQQQQTARSFTSPKSVASPIIPPPKHEPSVSPTTKRKIDSRIDTANRSAIPPIQGDGDVRDGELYQSNLRDIGRLLKSEDFRNILKYQDSLNFFKETKIMQPQEPKKSSSSSSSSSSPLLPLPSLFEDVPPVAKPSTKTDSEFDEYELANILEQAYQEKKTTKATPSPSILEKPITPDMRGTKQQRGPAKPSTAPSSSPTGMKKVVEPKRPETRVPATKTLTAAAKSGNIGKVRDTLMFKPESPTETIQISDGFTFEGPTKRKGKPEEKENEDEEMEEREEGEEEEEEDEGKKSDHMEVEGMTPYQELPDDWIDGCPPKPPTEIKKQTPKNGKKKEEKEEAEEENEDDEIISIATKKTQNKIMPKSMKKEEGKEVTSAKNALFHSKGKEKEKEEGEEGEGEGEGNITEAEFKERTEWINAWLASTEGQYATERERMKALKFEYFGEFYDKVTSEKKRKLIWSDIWWAIEKRNPHYSEQTHEEFVQKYRHEAEEQFPNIEVEPNLEYIVIESSAIMEESETSAEAEVKPVKQNDTEDVNDVLRNLRDDERMPDLEQLVPENPAVRKVAAKVRAKLSSMSLALADVSSQVNDQFVSYALVSQVLRANTAMNLDLAEKLGAIGKKELEAMSDQDKAIFDELEERLRLLHTRRDNINKVRKSIKRDIKNKPHVGHLREFMRILSGSNHDCIEREYGTAQQESICAITGSPIAVGETVWMISIVPFKTEGTSDGSSSAASSSAAAAATTATSSSSPSPSSFATGRADSDKHCKRFFVKASPIVILGEDGEPHEVDHYFMTEMILSFHRFVFYATYDEYEINRWLAHEGLGADTRKYTPKKKSKASKDSKSKASKDSKSKSNKGSKKTRKWPKQPGVTSVKTVLEKLLTVNSSPYADNIARYVMDCIKTAYLMVVLRAMCPSGSTTSQ